MVRGDLSPGDQLAQAIHAAVEFCVTHPDQARAWHEHNYLVVLAASDEMELSWLVDDARLAGVVATEFREPDLGDSLTAVALWGGDGSLTDHLPLALRKEVII